MSFPAAVCEICPDDKVRVRRHPEWGTGEVLRVSQTLGVYQAKVLFKAPRGERVESLPIEWLEKAEAAAADAAPAGRPPWDLVIFDEAHHLSRTRSGRKTKITQNYRLAESLRNHSRDLLFLSATPHQGNAFQFWSLVQLLDDQLFASPEAIADHRGLLNQVMIRRTKREVTDARGGPIFRRRQVHTERFSLGPRERMFYDRISEYLREGYDAAGIGQTRTGRADGGVEPVERIEWLGDGVGRGALTQSVTQLAGQPAPQLSIQPDIGNVARRFEAVKNSMILDWIPDRYRRARVTSQLVGLHRQ